MNHYILIHRLTGPAILLLLGIVALLGAGGCTRCISLFSCRCCSFCWAF